jgi:hypothetical protein
LLLALITTSLSPQTSYQLGQVLTLSYIVQGLFVTPFLGVLLDRIGFFPFALLQGALFAGLVAANLVRTYAALAVAAVVGPLYLCAWLCFLMRFAVLYAPPDLFGVFFGLLFSVMGGEG